MALYSRYDIAEIAQVSSQAVWKKLKGYPHADVRRTAGRNQYYYTDEVLALFPTVKFQAPVFNEPLKLKNKEVEVKIPRPDKDKSRVITEVLELRLVSLMLRKYLQQGKKNDIKRISDDTIETMWNEIKAELKGTKNDLPLDKFQWYFYSKRLMRADGDFVGYAKRSGEDSWKTQWESIHNVNKYNASMPTNRWDFLSLFHDMGLIGKGFGAGCMWVMDATQLDVWTKVDGKPELINYCMIMDVATGFPLYIHRLDDGESIASMAEALWKCALIYGVPAWGVVVDNGAAFKSKEIRNLVNSWYSDEHLEYLKKEERRKRNFSTADDPCNSPLVFPLPKMPRFPGKAKLERQFRETNRHQSERFALSYQGSTDKTKLTHELGSTPTEALKGAIEADIVWNDFVNFIYTDYVNRIRPSDFSYFKKISKEKTNIENVWRHCGGKLEIINNEYISGQKCISVRQENNNRVDIDIERSAPYAIFAIYSKRKHVVKAKSGYVFLTDSGVEYNFVLEAIKSCEEMKISVIVDNRKGYCYLEQAQNKKRNDKRVPNEGDVIFLGIATDTFMRQEADLEHRNLPNQVRKQLVKKNNEKISEVLGVGYKPVNLASSEPYKEIISYADNASSSLNQDPENTKQSTIEATAFYEVISSEAPRKSLTKKSTEQKTELSITELMRI